MILFLIGSIFLLPKSISGEKICGLRSSLNWNSSGTYEVSNGPKYFPWFKQLGLLEDDSVLVPLCSGTAVSDKVFLLPAHCLQNQPRERLRVDVGDLYSEVENVILHPGYNHSHPSKQRDLALLKIRSSFESFACLPDPGEDPVTGCQTAANVADTADVMYRSLSFVPSVKCLETSKLRGYVHSSGNIICSEVSECTIRGPVYCQSDERGVTLTGMETSGLDWCSVGAFTRIAEYLPWIRSTVEYLEGTSTSPRNLKNKKEEEEKADEDDKNPCSKKPCGSNAVCWNSGNSFMCTCGPKYPEGNPYYGCHECLYDQHCPSTKVCHKNKKICEKKMDVEQMIKNIPSQYVKYGSKYYFVSVESLPWLQSQYECKLLSGVLAELTGENDVEDLLTGLKKDNVTGGHYWIGASDFVEDGIFHWYEDGSTISIEQKGPVNSTIPDSEDPDLRCAVVHSNNGTLAAYSCEFRSKYVCQFSPAQSERNLQSLGDRKKRQGNFDTLNPRAKHKDICGRRFVRQSRIVGGGLSDYAEWPWQVSLRQYKSRKYRHKCGAALLTNQWVVTAAHCVKDISPSNLLMRIGEYNILDDRERHPHLDRRVSRVITHKRFDRFTYEYDIALIKLFSPVQFQPNVIPICLPESKSELVGEIGTVTGWGRRTEYGQISPILREVQLPIISNAKCMNMYRRSGQNEWIPSIFICAGTANGGKDSCEGDSGGPLVVKRKNGRYGLAGIISWGIGCGDRNRPGVYTRISEFKDWIIANTKY